MPKVRFDLHWDWCQSDLHPSSEQHTFACVRIGNISICEDCLIWYVNGWQRALEEQFLVEEHRRDLIGAVRCATLLVLGLEPAQSVCDRDV